ncbi:MAG: hypothetical protein LBK76_07495 [Verrucomicrobiales bacterium]|jgi:hypothetical protein|nr:hypothetical protein [Verrucomicrobiales bacterium]
MNDYLVAEDGQPLTTESGERLIVRRQAQRLLAENGKRLTAQSGRRILVERDPIVSAEFGEVNVVLQDDGTLTVTWDGEFHNVAEFEILHSFDYGETWQSVGIVSGRERGFNFPIDTLGETKVVALGVAGISMGSSAPAADDEQNDELPPSYVIIDLGIRDAVGPPHGLNDSGQVLLFSTGSARLWANGTVSTVATDINRVYGPTQTGKVYYPGTTERECAPGSEPPNPPFDYGWAIWKRKIFLWQNGNSSAQGFDRASAVIYLYPFSRINEIFGLAFLSGADIGRLSAGIPNNDYLTDDRVHDWGGGSELGFVNDADVWSYAGQFDVWSFGGGFRFYSLCRGVAGGQSFKLTASALDAGDGSYEVSGYCPAYLIHGTQGAIAYGKSPSSVFQTDENLYIQNNGPAKVLAEVTELHDINSAAGTQCFVIGYAGVYYKVWAYDGDRVASTYLGYVAGMNNSGVTGRKISNTMLVPLGLQIWQGNMARWKKSQLTGLTWTTHEICGEPEDWEDIHVTLVSPDKGLLAGTAMKTKDADGEALADPEEHSVLLIKTQLFDVGDTTSGLRDDLLDNGREISRWNPNKNITDKNIAWIKAHVSAQNPAPQMPKLELRLTGVSSTTTFKAKLKVQYHRGNGKRNNRDQPEDTVQIPADGGFKSITGNVWKIWEETDYNQQGFFGGDAELTYQLTRGEVAISNPLTIKFRIGGENPQPDKCRAFIESQPNAGPNGDLWFAYAIAKHESNGYNGSDTRYNQFLVTPKQIDDKKNIGLPVWHDDGDDVPGGYGLFQVTGNKDNAKANIPREQIWNWQENVKAGLTLIAAKNNIAVAWMTRQKNANNANGTHLPDLTVNGVLFSETTPHTMTAAVAIKAYNGASPAPAGFVDNDGLAPGFILDPQGSDHYCFWKNESNAWALSRFNKPRRSDIKPFNYVSLVCNEI